MLETYINIYSSQYGLVMIGQTMYGCIFASVEHMIALCMHGGVLCS